MEAVDREPPEKTTLDAEGHNGNADSLSDSLSSCFGTEMRLQKPHIVRHSSDLRMTCNAFRGRESQVRILPGPLSNYLETSGKAGRELHRKGDHRLRPRLVQRALWRVAVYQGMPEPPLVYDLCATCRVTGRCPFVTRRRG